VRVLLVSSLVACTAAGVAGAGSVSVPWAEIGVKLAAHAVELAADQSTRATRAIRHFLRTFERLTGVTPHQYVRRTRLREAARRLITERGTVLDIALDSGFGDVSNFNRAFRTEFGRSPLKFRRTLGTPGTPGTSIKG